MARVLKTLDITNGLEILEISMISLVPAIAAFWHFNEAHFASSNDHLTLAVVKQVTTGADNLEMLDPDDPGMAGESGETDILGPHVGCHRISHKNGDGKSQPLGTQQRHRATTWRITRQNPWLVSQNPLENQQAS